MRLIELEPEFLKIDPNDNHLYHHVDSVAEADGIHFLCPVCFKVNNGPVGTHGIICWRPHVPQTVYPVPGRWNFNGTGYGDLTLVAGSSSVFLTDAPCKAHFHVTNGEII